MCSACGFLIAYGIGYFLLDCMLNHVQSLVAVVTATVVDRSLSSFKIEIVSKGEEDLDNALLRHGPQRRNSTLLFP